MRKVLPVSTLVLLCLVVGISGCSQGESQSTATGGALDRKVLSLGQGTSVDAVEATLGTPASKVVDGEATVLFYGGWRLAFVGESLERRSREHWPRTRTLPAGERLDLEVLELRPGMSIKAVKFRLGDPRVYEEVFEASPSPEKILRYAQWEISFSDDRLVRRTSF